jgi:CubicO group peptidase (beta-lactamase class C family)
MRGTTTLTLLGLVLLGLLAAPAAGQDYVDHRQLPDGAVGERIEELLDVVNSDDRLTESWSAVILDVEPDPPHLIAGLQLAPARPPADAEGVLEALTDEQIAAELAAFVERLAEADAFSGSVLLARDGKVLHTSAHGLASRRFDVPNRVDTKFNLGSMNKMFTGVAVMQLVEAGKLALDDRLSQYVGTDWLPAEITDKIQIQHLLTHTSGLGSYFNETFMESSRLRFRELDDYKPLVQGETLAFEPGTDRRYSNTGMLLLGVVITEASGQDYFDYVREHIYAPAGMADSDCYDMDRPVPNLAIGYTMEGGEWANNLYLHVVRGGPAGGGFSTVEDLLRFDQALRGHELLSAEGTERVWSAKPELGSPEYGFGFGISGTPDDRIVGHSGGFAGINSNLDMFLDSGYTAVVMSNTDQGAMPVVQKIQELVAARE